MSEKVERDRVGTIIHETDVPEKMEVEYTEVKSYGDFDSPVYIYYNWCKKCGICVAFCPTGCLESKPDGSPFVAHPEKCIHCETCDRLCPDFAITGAAKKKGDNCND
ncbi:MAG: 2-oxoglutarate ferredoxin oxidoreductase subunit delta [Candidatus Cloacimonetes bacterium 4572_65]|nr:MAG: 2-oxoglutarate ferredoxin oxidoreductase subunit delta [Candidatus Cloacimonetes bacterium 4572_65]